MRHRTALITAAAIAAVVFASAIAVGANLGILTVADSIPVGKLTVATVAPTSAPAPAPAPAYVGAHKTTDSQKYIIRKAGAVELSVSKAGVRLVDVAARRHWRWTLTQTRDRKLTVTFKHGSLTYTFVAAVSRHGKLTAKVDHPITKIGPSTPSASSTSWVAAPAPAPSAASAPQASGGEWGHGGDGSQEGGGQDD